MATPFEKLPQEKQTATLVALFVGPLMAGAASSLIDLLVSVLFAGGVALLAYLVTLRILERRANRGR